MECKENGYCACLFSKVWKNYHSAFPSLGKVATGRGFQPFGAVGRGAFFVMSQ